MLRTILLALIFAPAVVAQTYIDYSDGSAYTLEPTEEAYVTHEIVFVKREYASGSVYFKVLSPNVKRNYTATPWDGLQQGSHEWCKQYIPWSEGYTFNMQTWQRSCDTNGDGEYDEDDDGWSE